VTRACSSAEEIALLVDGELTENRAAAVRDHLQECPVCRHEVEAVRALVRDVVAPVAPRPGALDRLVARFEETPRAVGTPGRLRALPWARIGAALAAAAAVVVAIGLHGRGSDGARTMIARDVASAPSSPAREGTLTPRGVAAPPSIVRQAGITVYQGIGHLAPVRNGDVVDIYTAYSVGYRNLGVGDAAFAMVFAVDAAGGVHWIAPAWLDEHTDPASEPMPHAERETPPVNAVALDTPAPGIMRVVTMMTPAPLHVSEVERMLHGHRDVGFLRGSVPGAVIDETTVDVARNVPGTLEAR
jgi:anti-sigma factor RsiW